MDFQQDGAPAHGSKHFNEYIRETFSQLFEDWSPSSTDINPIRTISGILGSEMIHRILSKKTVWLKTFLRFGMKSSLEND
jgi:hypothetical protein